MKANSAIGTILDDLATIVGSDHVLADSGRDFYAHDVYRQRALPLAVVRPGTVEELQQIVAVATGAGLAIVPRGGGASYTDGYLPDTDASVVIDTRRLNRILEIDEQDMFVTVEPGVTWATLTRELAKRGLRTPFFGPFSGLVATVGGSVSQNTTSHGSGGHGNSAESVIAMEIVLASGAVLKTGQAGSSTGHPFFRHYGPDLTALFTGDCGALGIKARLTLRLIRLRPVVKGLSFGFDSFEALQKSAAAIAAEGLDDENFGLDQVLSQGQIARNAGAARKIAIIKEIVHTSPNLLDAGAKLFRLATTDPRSLERLKYFMHYIVTGVEPAAVAAKLTVMRRLAKPHGSEIANAVPTIVHSMPFAPLNNILGPRGERWVPLHGILPHSQVTAYHRAATALFDRHRSEMARLHVHNGLMFVTLGTGAFLYEVALYWEDERTVFHDTMLDAAYLQRLPTYPANPEGAALVELLKSSLIDLFHHFGAAHFQVGKVYPLLRDRDPEWVALLSGLKATLDPRGLMNPGALGLPSVQQSGR